MHRLTALLPDGLARRADLTRTTSSSSVGRWLSDGELVLVHPGVVALLDRAAEWSVRASAAVLWTGGPLSHLSALVAAGLVTAPDGPVHVTVPLDRCPRGGSSVIAHRSRRRLVTIRCGRLEVVEPTRSLVDAWSWAHAPRRNPVAGREAPSMRRALIEGVRGHGAQVAAVRAESDRRPRHPGRARLLDLLDLVADGCRSELEIWGVRQVLPGPPQLPGYVQQHPVQLPSGRHVHLDAAYVEACVAVELDGAAFHGSREARERDLRRDSALAALGWVVLRFSYERLTGTPRGAGLEIVAVVGRRLAQH